MASHGNAHQTPHDTPHTTPRGVDDRVQLGQAASGVKFAALGIGVIALLVAVVVGFFMDANPVEGRSRFYHAYLTGIAWCLSISLGGLFFVLMHHMVKVGWSVNIRRVPEALAATLPYLGILTIPLFIPVIGQKGGELYPWAVPHVEVVAHDGAALHGESLPAQAAHGQLAHAAIVADEPAALLPPGEHAADLPPRETSLAAEGTAAGHVAIETSGLHAGTDPEIAAVPPGEQSTVDYMLYDELTQEKSAWLNGPFFIARIVLYFAIWTVIGWYYFTKSKQQDLSGDVEISKHLAIVAPVSIIVFALTATFASFDLIMSLDHHWFSTIFGVYIFAGGMIGMFATTIITFRYLQSKGLLAGSISTEHYHDLGKYLFAFVFFWSYVGFSQFMLQWYANIPEETQWWQRRGVSSADTLMNTQHGISGFAGLSLVLLFGHFLLPFAYLISRHVKRSKEALLFGAGWLLLAHMVDMYWLIMPEYDNGKWVLDLTIIAAIVGVIGLFVFAFLQTLGSANLRPIGDPRTDESMAFVNM